MLERTVKHVYCKFYYAPVYTCHAFIDLLRLVSISAWMRTEEVWRESYRVDFATWDQPGWIYVSYFSSPTNQGWGLIDSMAFTYLSRDLGLRSNTGLRLLNEFGG